jgi:hypothetical protein
VSPSFAVTSSLEQADIKTEPTSRAITMRTDANLFNYSTPTLSYFYIPAGICPIPLPASDYKMYVFRFIPTFAFSPRVNHGIIAFFVL